MGCFLIPTNMKFRFGLRTKMVLLFATIIVAVFTIAFWILNSLFVDQIKQEAENSVVISVNKSVQEVKTILTEQFSIITSTVNFLKSDYIQSDNSKIDYFTKYLSRNILENSSKYYSVWIDWELSHADKTYKKLNGRHSYSYYRENGIIKYAEEIHDTTNNVIEGDYYQMKKNNRSYLFEPYYYSFNETDSVIMTSLASPIKNKEDKFIGLVGLDITLDKFAEITAGLIPFEGSKAFMMSQSGKFITHYNSEYVGKNFYDLFPTDDQKYGMLDKMSKGESFTFYLTKDDGNETFVAFVPIKLDKVDGVWYMGVHVPVNVILKEADKVYSNGTIIILGVMLILILFVWVVSNSITRPLIGITKILKRVAKGEISTSMKVDTRSYARDEIEDIKQSVNTLIDGLNNTSEFAISIGNGNLEKQYNVLSENDKLGLSLLEMRSSLKNARDIDALRKEEGRQQQWMATGLANFAQLLRENQSDMEEFSYQILNSLLQYVDATVGGFYLVEDVDGEQYIELKASVAYEQRKFINQKLEIHEGLIGQCILENDVIFLTDLPKNYIRIVSGLGSDSPDCLMLVPLKVNDIVFGVIEIAAFKILEDYQREFIVKVADNIASTISSVKVNIRTKELLELSKQKSEELAAQEEEMRQNLEELQVTQEESDRKTQEIGNLLDSLSKSNFFVEYNTVGKITEVNDKYASLFELTRDQMLGMSFFDSDLKLENKEEVWRSVKEGSVYKNQNNVVIGNRNFTLLETYTPIFDMSGKLMKVLKISNQLSDFVK